MSDMDESHTKKDEKITTKEVEEDIGVCLSDKTKKFKVPPTYDCLETLVTPKKWMEIPVLLQIILLSFYTVLYFLKLNPYVSVKKTN